MPVRWQADVRALRGVLIAYALLGVALWPWPLVGLLHVESAAVVAFAAFFVAGLSALRLFEAGGRGFGRVLAMQEAALVVPAALLTVTLLWRPNCGFFQGLLLYALFPVVTVVLAVAVAYALSGVRWRGRRAIFVGGGLLAALGGVVYDLGFHPQFYTYSHVFGGVLGPIYDEELALRAGLFSFRALTLLWAFFFFLMGRWARGAGAARKEGEARLAPTGALIVGAVVLIGAAYFFSARLGFNTPAWHLQEELGGHLRTEHFDIYFDPEAVTPDERKHLAEDHEYRYAWLEERLGAAPRGRIQSYLYPSEEAKARLTGARTTSVAPVWLPRPQVHLLRKAYDQSFGHELVHVFSRAFGLPVVKASVAVGLVEGLAVALEPPDGRPGPHEQVLTAALSKTAFSEAAFSPQEPGAGLGLAADVAARLSPAGFWTGRGAVSYTTAGSFVRFLIERYGAGRFRRAYAWADFEAVYGKPVEVLAEEWERYLLGLPVVATGTEALVTRRFAVPSLFEKRCPHHVPAYARAFRAGERALAEKDTAAAALHFERALAERPGFTAARVQAARLTLAGGEAEAAIAALDTVAMERRTPGLLVTLGDAYALAGRAALAQEQYAAALERLPMFSEGLRAQVVLRALLADRPDAIGVMASALGEGEKADRLIRLEPSGPAIQMQQAVLLMAAGRYEPAGWALRNMGLPTGMTPYQRAVLTRQRLAWIAQSVYRAGRPDVASGYASEAARAFRGAGALNEAAYFDDFIEKMSWVQRNRIFDAASQ